MKYYIKGVFGNLTNKLVFSDQMEDVMLFNSVEEAKESMIMYGCDNCIIKEKQ